MPLPDQPLRMEDLLFAPRQAPYAFEAPPIDNNMLTAAGLGVLGRNVGSFVMEMGRAQQMAQMEQATQSAADEIDQLNPLQPDYHDKVASVQRRYGRNFMSPMVGEALQRGGTTRREVIKRAEKSRNAALVAFARKATPEQIDALWEAEPELAAENAPTLMAREKALSEAATMSAQLPGHLLTKIDANDPLAVQREVTKFRNSLPLAARKIEDLPTLMGLAEDSRRYLELSKKDIATLSDEDKAKMTSYYSSIAGNLGKADVDDEVIGTLAEMERTLKSPAAYYASKPMHPEAAKKYAEYLQKQQAKK